MSSVIAINSRAIYDPTSGIVIVSLSFQSPQNSLALNNLELHALDLVMKKAIKRHGEEGASEIIEEKKDVFATEMDGWMDGCGLVVVVMRKKAHSLSVCPPGRPAPQFRQGVRRGWCLKLWCLRC